MRTFRKIIFIAVCFLGIQINAQQAQQILGIANEIKDIAYYQEQSSLWEKKTKISPKSGNAWENYYKSKRAYYQKQDYKSWVNNQERVFVKLNPIIEKVKENLPNSFEYYYLKSVNTNNKEEAFKLLLKAYNLNPNRPQVYEDLFAYYMMHWKVDKAKVLADKIRRANLYANAVYLWNLNNLNSAIKNSIVITTGDMDTLPRWVVQISDDIRPDVLILNQWLLATNKEYRKGVFSKLKIKPFDKLEVDFENKEAYKNAMLIYIIKSVGGSQTIHFDCGTDIELFEKLGIKDKMYLTGINFTYSKVAIDNLSITKRNFEQVLHLDYLTSNYQVHFQNKLVKQALNVSYIPGLMKLKKYYYKKGDIAKVTEYDKLINVIVTASGREKEILSWYGE